MDSVPRYGITPRAMELVLEATIARVPEREEELLSMLTQVINVVHEYVENNNDWRTLPHDV